MLLRVTDMSLLERTEERGKEILSMERVDPHIGERDDTSLLPSSLIRSLENFQSPTLVHLLTFD